MRRRPALFLLTLLLTACGGDLQTPGEALRIFSASLPQAFAGEPYSATLRAVGGLRPFNYEVRGRLPPGLRLQNGVIEGVPTQLGTFEFTVEVSDANLSRTFRDYSLAVVERPSPRILIVAPETEVREPTTIRLRSENASELRAVSILLSWNPANFELVAGPPKAGAGTALLWHAEPGSLQVDIAALGDAWNDDGQLLSLTLSPKQPARPRLTVEAVFLDDRGGRHFQTLQQTRPPDSPGDVTEGDTTDAGPDESPDETPEDPPLDGPEDSGEPDDAGRDDATSGDGPEDAGEPGDSGEEQP